MKRLLILTGVLLLCLQANAQPYLQSCAVDVSQDFTDFSNTYFFADSLASFDPATAEGSIRWKRHSLFGRQAFNTTKVFPLPLDMLDFPPTQYENDPQLHFSIDFVSPVTIRLRVYTSSVILPEEESLMLTGTPPRDESWTYKRGNGTHTYTGRGGSIIIREYPFTIMLCDERGREMTRTRHWADNDSTQIKVLPFQFIKRASDNIRSINPVFSLRPNEKIVGCGESPTALNKVGQKVHLFVTDPQSPEGDQMYKPIPFFISNRGYGMFMHTSAPVTCDFGATHVGSAKLFMADETLDLFLFWGKPAGIIDEYTSLTGKATMPPLWSFGTWMSRITYFSQEEGYEVARQLRQNRIPADVIHFDTGWFQTDWQCDYVFAPDRFPDAQKMINDLLADGFHISLWQLPYFTPKNKYFPELIEKGLYVKNEKGGLPYEDVVLDFSNPETVTWYQEKLEGLLKMGVGAIKVDFGEGAPLNGYYANGKGGLYEHNLYPLRYNKAVAEITRKTKNETIIWARSAWAGSQRYPLHWGGDAANTDIGMLTTLRSGLSLGLCGFSFWSHDIGGFVQSCPEELYSRWLPFGFLTSHTRVHGAPPTEPWYYSNDFMDGFRRSAELKYRLMPYIVEQSQKCTQTGLPMLRALLIEYPDDPVVWQIEDQYLFGSDMMVAPLFESDNERMVYLPVDRWVDYQSGKTYDPGWHRVAAGQIPAVILVRKGAEIPHVPVAQSTDEIDWEKVKKIKY
ncbi:MAG: alpha-xylosidase [Bacteroidales bacterium]|jgi:alpha-D-xyloside xylohydrolase|nr:alpha-xylosidase [Bacteroidales bacterium]